MKPEMPSPDDNAAWDTEAALLHLMFPDRFLIYSGNALPDPNGTDPTFGINGCRGLHELGWINESEHLRHFKEKYTDHGMALLRACRRVAKNIPSIRKRVVLDHKKMSRPLDRSSL